MTLIIECTTCGRQLRSQDRYAGMRVRCPQCGTINELPTLAAAPPPAASCSVCGKDCASESNLVMDTRGRYYHRSCYEQARHHQAGWTPSQLEQPRDMAAPKNPGPAMAELDSLAQLEPSVDDLWKNLSRSAGVATAGLPAPAMAEPLASRRDHAWMYAIMGFAAALPIVVLLFIVVQLIVNSLELPRRPAGPSQAPTVTASDDHASSSTTTPARTDQPGRKPQK